MKAALDSGHTIGRIARFGNARLQRLLAAAEQAAPAAPVPARESVDMEPVVGALVRFDVGALERELNRLATTMAPRDFVLQVALPFMSRVGDDWHAGRLSVAHEHLASALLRSLLGALIRLYSWSAHGSRLLFATPGGERHEFGTLAAAMLAASRGHDVVYLGADVPGADIAVAARQAEAQAVVLGVHRTTDDREPLAHVRDLSQQLPKDVGLWIGGGNAASAAAVAGVRGVALRDLHQFEERLARLGAKF
jgi:MerR family transcriptional regulator, light-induced transcriptional regulator